MIDWRAIDTVLLDMDGTLLDLHFDSHFWLEHLPRRYVELHQLDEATQEVVRSKVLREQGTLNWYSLDYWSRELDVDVVALKREIQHLIGLRGDALDFPDLDPGPFDVVMNDVDKEAYPRFAPLAVDRLRPGGLYMAASALWYGKVCVYGTTWDAWTSSVHQHNEWLFAQDHLFTQIHDSTDGLLVTVRRR